MKSLTLQYSATQFTYWATSSGASAFATAYMLGLGIPSGTIGIMLAAAKLLSCATQPLLAARADRAQKFILTRLLILLSALCCGCFALQLLPGLPVYAAGLLYMAGIWGSEAMTPLLNALSVTLNQTGHPVNYGAARGIGSMATALSALVVGVVLERFGMQWMLVFLVGFRLMNIATFFKYPKIEKQAEEKQQNKSCSVPAFVSRYPRYCVSLLGISFLGMYHAMTENYLISIMQRLGGGSSHVGTALFISAMVSAPVIFFFNTVRKRLADNWLLKIAALSFLLKSLLFCCAQSIGMIYLFQLLQMTSYAFLAPTQVYYAGARVAPEDMVKGQAFITAAYTLGCSAGGFAGGQLLSFGVPALLWAGVAMALCGTIIIFITVDQRRAK